MMCIVRLNNGEITGWMIGTDPHDLRRSCADPSLAEKLYRLEFPARGKHDLGDGEWLLVG